MLDGSWIIVGYKIDILAVSYHASLGGVIVSASSVALNYIATTRVNLVN